MFNRRLYCSILFFFLSIILTHQSTQQVLTFCYRGPQCYEINDHTFDQKYDNQLEQLLNKVTFLKVHELKLSEQNYLQLFSHSMPKLKKIQFWNHDPQNVRDQYRVSNTLTPAIIEKIFTSSYFEQLEQLNLSKTLIQFRHFLFLENKKLKITSNLKMLYLIGTYFEERAFNLLKKIEFNGKLEILGLAETSLISPRSIDFILEIIKSPHKNQKSQLRNLTVYNTAITTDNMIRLLQSIDISKMTSLNLGHNSFQHSKSFKIPFNNKFFEYLSRCDFSSLKRLSMSEMDLDNDQLQYLRKIHLPLLENLDLPTNFITDDYFQQWITRNNMPRLKSLNIIENNITDHAIQLLVNHNFQNLTTLALSNNRRLTSRHLVHMSKMNTSQLIRLQMSHNAMFEKDLRVFFSKPFQSLLQLSIIMAYDVFQFFDFVNWKEMRSLRYLNLVETDLSQSFSLVRERNITFPQLKVFKLGGAWIAKEHIQQLLSNLVNFSPVLQLVQFEDSQLNPHTYYFNLSSLNSSTVPIGSYIRSGGLSVYKSPKTNRLQVTEVILGERSGNNFWETMFSYQFFGDYQESDPYFYMFYSNGTQMRNVINYLKQCADWGNVEKFYMDQLNDINAFLALYFFDSMVILQKSFEEFNAFIKHNKEFKPSLYFPYLRDINYIPTLASMTPQQPRFYFFLTKMISPLLNVIQMGSEPNDAFVPFLNRLIKQNSQIKNLFMIDSKMTCQMFQRILDGLTLPFLSQLLVTRNQLQLECLEGFLERHRTIKFLVVADNFLQKGLFDVIAQNQMILQGLDFSSMQIGNDQFAKLSKINRQFFTKFQASTTDINSQGIKMLVGNNTQQRLFPKCYEIGLARNNINQDGVKALLQTGMPFIKRIMLLQVSNPNLFNEMFSYPNHFENIIIQDANIYGIDQKLDPRSTRNVKFLQLRSPSLTLEDYQVLSRMDFLNLIGISLVIENIYQCEILKYILKIVQNTDRLMVDVTNQRNKDKWLNDKCLPANTPTQIYMKHLNGFNIVWEKQLAYIPNFYTYFYSQNQRVSSLILANSLIGDDVLIEIVENCNLEHLWVAVLFNNLLTDKSVQKLFSLPLKHIKSIQIHKNQISHRSLSKLQNKTLYQLVDLDLSMNPIGDQGIQQLTKAHFPKLLFLKLQNSDITKQGLMKLAKLNSPQLAELDLSNNLFNQIDFIQFLQQIQIHNFPLLTKIDTSIRVNELNSKRINEIVKNKIMAESMTITYDQYRLEMENKAEL